MCSEFANSLSGSGGDRDKPSISNFRFRHCLPDLELKPALSMRELMQYAKGRVWPLLGESGSGHGSGLCLWLGLWRLQCSRPVVGETHTWTAWQVKVLARYTGADNSAPATDRCVLISHVHVCSAVHLYVHLYFSI